MSRIFRRKGSPNWYYSMGAGKDRVYKSTKTPHRHVAKLIQAKWDEKYILRKFGIQNIIVSKLINEYINII